MLLFLLCCFLIPAYAGGNCYVKVRPTGPTVVVHAGPRPGPNHVWVDGYWAWNPGPGRYDWVAGSWRIPPGRYTVWVPGHWKKTRYGWYWVDGHWK